MESKHKNILIGALLAVVFVMAVGYAAFAQTLTINGSAEITSNWHVGFDTSKTTDEPGVVTPKTGANGTTAPSGEVSYTNDQNATISADLVQPGDKVTFTLTIENYGNINAKLNTPVVSLNGEGSDENENPLIVKQGNIIFTVTAPSPTTIDEGETATMTVTAEFDSSAQSVGTTTSSSITVTTLASQAA